MEMIGMDVKPTGGRSAPVAPSSVARPTNLHQQSLTAAARTEPSQAPEQTPTPPPQPAKPQIFKKEAVKREEKDAAHPVEPWLEIHKGNFKALKVTCADCCIEFQKSHAQACFAVLSSAFVQVMGKSAA